MLAYEFVDNTKIVFHYYWSLTWEKNWKFKRTMSFLGAKKKEQFTTLPDGMNKWLPSGHFGRKKRIAVEQSLKKHKWVKQTQAFNKIIVPWVSVGIQWVHEIVAVPRDTKLVQIQFLLFAQQPCLFE